MGRSVLDVGYNINGGMVLTRGHRTDGKTALTSPIGSEIMAPERTSKHFRLTCKNHHYSDEETNDRWLQMVSVTDPQRAMNALWGFLKCGPEIHEGRRGIWEKQLG